MNFNLITISKYKILSGYSYGINSMVCELTVNISKDFIFPLKKSNQILQRSFSIDNISERIKETSDCEELINNLFYWYKKLNKRIRVPIADSFYIKKLQVNEDTISYKIAFNSFHQNVTNNILESLLNHFNFVHENNKTKTLIEHYDLTEINGFLDTLRPFSVIDTNNMNFIIALIKLEIPYRLIGDVLTLGSGIHLKYLSSTTTELTPNISVKMSRLKDITTALLKQHAMPVPDQFYVPSIEHALNCAKSIGYPVVLKPTNQDGGVGVSNNIQSEQELSRIYQQTVKEFNSLVMEKHVFGEDFRFTVINGKVVKIMKRTAGGVIGNGKNSIKVLVEKLQKTPINKKKFIKYNRHLVELDNEALDLLSARKYTPETVLSKGEYIALRRNNNISTGGTIELLENHQVHPDNLNLALEAANIFQLDIAGIDIISEDISQSWMSNNTTICEVNSIPEIAHRDRLHIYEDFILDYMKNGVRIPIDLNIVSRKQIQDNDFFQELLQDKQYNNFSFGNFVVINNSIYTNRAVDSFESAKALLMNKCVNKAYCFIDVELIREKGLPFDKFDEINIDFDQNEVLDIIEQVQAHTDNLKCKNKKI